MGRAATAWKPPDDIGQGSADGGSDRPTMVGLVVALTSANYLATAPKGVTGMEAHVV